MIEQIQNWDRNSQPAKAGDVVEHDEFKALPPAGKIDTLNKLQAQWADVYSVELPKEDYAGALRDMETWFGDQRKAIVKKGLAEDMAAGKLTDKQVQAYMTQGPDALDDAGRQHFAQKYGDPRMVAGPWVTTKAPIVGADGKPVGFQYIRRRPSLNGQAIAENMGIPGDKWNQAGYLMHNAGAQEPLTWKNPDNADNIEVSWTVNGNDGKQYHGVEQVSGGEQFARLADAQRSMAYYQGMTDPGMSGPSRETADLANLPDVAGSEGLPAALAADAVSRRLQGDPEIAKKIGQGFLAGLPGEAMKGFLTYGAAARYGPFALMGDKDALKEYEKAQDMLETDIEGQSQLGFRGEMSDKVLKGISAELPGMAFSMGASAGAAVVRKAVQTGARAAAAGLTLRGMTPAAAESIITSGGTRVGAQSGAQFAAQRAGQTTLNEGLAAGIARGVLTKITDKKSLIGKLIGTADLESKLVKNISDRVLTSVSFLPSAMRSGLDNMSTTLDAAEDLRKQGKIKEADALEESAMRNGWAGVFIELGSEAMWLNELMVTKAGRSFGDVATDVLGKKIGAGKLAQVTELFKRAVVGGNQEGIEEIVAGVGNRAWMNQFAGQNQDVFAGIDEEYLTGAALGGVISGIKAARDIAPEKAAMATEMLYRSVLGDQEAKAFVADVRARAEAQAAAPQATPTPATPSSEPPAAAVPVATPTPPVTPEPVAPETAPAPVSSAGPAVSPAPVTPAVPVPRAFAPIAPMPEERTPDEVARVLYDARADAVDVANDAVAVPGAEVAAEALASIAADEELPSATDVESATMAEPANVPESDFGDIESPEEFDGTVDRIVDELKSGNRAGAMSIFSGLSATDIERVTAEITGAGFNNQTRADMLADLDNRLKFKNQSAREVFYTLDKDRAALRAKRTPKPISPDGNIATPSTETPALPLAETAQEPAIAPAAESAATPEKPLQPVANKSAVWTDDESKRADAIMERYGPQIDEVDADQLDAFAEKFGVKRRGKSDSALREEIKGQHPDDILAAFTGNPTQQEPTTETGRQVKEAFAGMASAATEGARRRVAELIDKGPYILENKAAGDAALANPDYRAERLPDGRVQITDVVNPDTGTWHREAKAPATKPEQMSPEVERLKYLKSREVNAAGGTSLSDADTAEALASIAADEEVSFLDAEAARSGLAAIGEQAAPAAKWYQAQKSATPSEPDYSVTGRVISRFTGDLVEAAKAAVKKMKDRGYTPTVKFAIQQGVGNSLGEKMVSAIPKGENVMYAHIDNPTARLAFLGDGTVVQFDAVKSAASEKPESGAVATASPEPVPSGAPAKNLAKSDTNQAVVNSPAPQLVDREFTPGEILEMRSPYTGDVVSVNYRGPLGDKSVVVMEKGGQTSVPTAWLSRSREAQLEILKQEFDDAMRVVEDKDYLIEKGKTLPAEYVAADREANAILKKIQELEKPIKEAEAKAKAEKDAADAKARSEKRDERIASLPVFQKRNGWEIVKDFEQRYILRDPNTKEEVYAGTLARVRKVADESPPTPVVKNEDEGAVNEYAYGMKARPFDIGAQPKGFSRVDESDKRSRWGVIYYSEPLSESQVRQYELVPLEKEKAAPDPYRPSGNDFPSAGVEPTLPAAGDSKSISKKASQASDLVIPRKADGTLVDPIRPTWDDKSRMDAEQYGYVTDGKKLYIIDRQKSSPMQEAKPATTFADEVSGKWNLYVREYAEDGTQGKSKRMPIPENTLYPVKSSEKWYQRKAEVKSTPAPVQQNQPGPARISGIVSGDAATVSVAIRNIANDKSAPKHQRRAAADIAGVLETTPITVRFEEMDTDTNGYYDPASGEVRINLNGPHELGVSETILHELAHAVTDSSLVNPDTAEKKALAESVRQQFEFARKRADGLIRNKKALGAKALELSNDELLDEVRKLNDDALYDIVSGTRDLYEFAALILTSDAMQKFAGGINPNGEAKTVWDRVVDAIAKFFGKEITSAASAAYDALLKLTPQKGDVRGPRRYSMARTDVRYSKRRRATQGGVSGVGPEYAVESRNAIRSAVIDRVFDSTKMDPASIDDYQTAYELARKVTSGNPEDLKEIQQMILGHPDMVEAGLVGDRQLDALPAEIYKELMRFAGRLAAQGGYGGRADFSLFVLMMSRYGRLLDAMPNVTDDGMPGETRGARRLGSLAGMPFKDFIKAHFGQLAQIEDEMLKQGFTPEQLDAMRQFFEGALEPEAVDAAVAAREPEWQKPNEALTAMLQDAGVPYDPNAPVQLSPKELALLPKDIQQAYKDMLAGKLGQAMDAEAAKQADELFNAREQETQRGIQQLTDTFFIGLNREENPGFIAQKTAAVNGELAGIIRETLDELGIVPNEKAFDPESVFRKILMALGGDQLRLEKLPLLEEAIQQKIMQIFDVATLEEAMEFPKARELWSQWESVSANLMQSSTVSGSTVRRAFHQVMQQPAFDYSTSSLLAMRPEHLLVARDRIVSAVMESLRTISATAPSNIQPEMWASIEAGVVNQFNGMMAQAAEARAQANAEAAAKLGPDAETVLQAQIRRVLARHATEDTPSKTAKKKDALNELVDEHLKKADPDIESKLKALGVSDAAVAEILRAVESTRFARAELKKYKDQQRKDKAAARALDALMEKMGPRDKSVIRANEVVGPVTIGDIAKILMEADPSKVHDMAWRRGIITAWLGNMGIIEARVKAESLDFLIASAFADAQASMVNKFVGSMKTKAPKPAPSELERIAKAIRIGFVSGAPTSWQEAFAARFKMSVPTTAEMQEMIRLENIRTDDSANQTDRVAAQGKLSALYNKFKGDPKFIVTLADNNTQSMLTGLTTQGMQFQQGLFNYAFRITEEMTTGIFKKDSIATLLRAIDESFDAYVLAFGSAWKNDTYRNQMQEEIQRMSSLKQLLHKEWNEYKNASKLQRMDPRRIIKLAMGAQDWARRLMSSADDAALTGIKVFVSTIEAGKLAKAKGLTSEQIKNIYDVAKANVSDLLLEANARGYSHSMAKLWVRDEVEGNIRKGMIAAGVSEQDLDEIDDFSTRESEFDVGVGKLRDTGSFWDPIQVAGEWLTSFLEKATLISDEDRASGNVKVAMRSIFFRNLFGFLRTPFNMMSRQVYRSPFGLYRLAITAKGDRAKTLYARSMGTARQRQQRFKEAVIWSTFEAALWAIAVMLNGEDDDPDDDILIINGQGPEDDQAAAAWRTQHQSNSIEIKVGGSKIVIPFTRIGLEGLKPGLMILGALRDAQLDGLKKNEAVALGAFALNYGVNTAYSSGTFGLKNIMDWKRTFSGTNRAIQALSYSTSSLLPWSGAMRSIGKLASPDVPDKGTVRGAIAAATPLFFIGEKAYNVYGLPIYGETNGLVDGISKRLMYGFGLPIGVFQGGDDAEKAVMNWTVKTGVAPTSVERTSLDKRLLAYDKDHTPLSDEDWTKFSKTAGRTRMEGMKMALPMLDNLTDSGIKTRMKTIGDQAESAGLQAIGKSLGQ